MNTAPSVMTTPDILTLMAAAGVLIATIITAIVNAVIGLRTNRAIGEVAAKASVIEGHVNSAATKSAGEIAALRAHVERLVARLALEDQKAAVLAQSTADRQIRRDEGGNSPGATSTPVTVSGKLHLEDAPGTVEK